MHRRAAVVCYGRGRHREESTARAVGRLVVVYLRRVVLPRAFFYFVAATRRVLALVYFVFGFKHLGGSRIDLR